MGGNKTQDRRGELQGQLASYWDQEKGMGKRKTV